MNNRSEANAGAVVLAAGESRRLGRPKQLLVHGGRTLLGRTIDAALAAGIDPIVVVLGSSAVEIQESLGALPKAVRFVENAGWKDGMGTSISCGVKELATATPDIGSALILVCDQPELNAGLLKQFMRVRAANPDKILLADYGTGKGPPVLFPRIYFDALVSLGGDAGAREVHRRHAGSVLAVPFPGGDIDIDTPSDLDRIAR